LSPPTEQLEPETVLIRARFNGPPRSANGGYACGLLARRIGGTVEARLYTPPPLERAMDARWEGENFRLYDGERRVAAAWRSSLQLDVPEPPSRREAEAAGASRAGIAHLERHPFPTCFVCGSERAEGDGLRIFPGPLPGRPAWATVWTPPRSLAEPSGRLPTEIVWAALDCPTIAPFLATDPIVLSNLTVEMRDSVWADRPHVVLCWPLRAEGRKRFGAAALFDDSNKLIAASSATWVGPGTE
jgi:hypothetical protein